MQTKTFFALGDYENLEVEFKEIDLIGSDNLEKLLSEVTDGKVIYDLKSVCVKARKAKLGEIVDTSPRCVIDDRIYYFKETQKVVTQKDVDNQSMIVTNPLGEEYVVKGQKFKDSYKDLGGGAFQPIWEEKKFVTVTENICFKAPWGEMIYSPKGSKLCVEYLKSRDIYSVTNLALVFT